MAKAFMVRLAGKSGPLSEDGGDDSLSWHKSLARSLTALDGICGHAGLRRLSEFLSEDPDNVHDAVDDEDEAEELLATLPPVRWSSPADALPTVRALIELLAAGESVGGVRNVAGATEELRDIEAILRHGIAKKAAFRFYTEF